MRTTSNWASEVGVVKADYFDFSWKKLKNKCELDIRVIACNF
jgi:penicillin-binding protein-related factor A (putative recombinase)